MSVKEKTGKELVAFFEAVVRTHDRKGSYPPEYFYSIEKEYIETKRELLSYIEQLEEKWRKKPKHG